MYNIIQGIEYLIRKSVDSLYSKNNTNLTSQVFFAEISDTQHQEPTNSKTMNNSINNTSHTNKITDDLIKKAENILRGRS